AHLSARGMYLIYNTQQVLNVVAHFMCDNIGLGKISRCLKTALQFIEETQIDIQFFIGAAVKRSGGRACMSARRTHAPGTQDQSVFTIPVEQTVPYILCVRQHHRRKYRELLTLRRRRVCSPLFYSQTSTTSRNFLE